MFYMSRHLRHINILYTPYLPESPPYPLILKFNILSFHFLRMSVCIQSENFSTVNKEKCQLKEQRVTAKILTERGAL